jgi:hypothetical protein
LGRDKEDAAAVLLPPEDSGSKDHLDLKSEENLDLFAIQNASISSFDGRPKRLLGHMRPARVSSVAIYGGRAGLNAARCCCGGVFLTGYRLRAPLAVLLLLRPPPPPPPPALLPLSPSRQPHY